MLDGVISRIQRSDNKEITIEERKNTVTGGQKKEQYAARGYLEDDEIFQEWCSDEFGWEDFEEAEMPAAFVAPVSVETYTDLAELDCFSEVGRNGRDAIMFARKYSEAMNLYIEFMFIDVSDDEEDMTEDKRLKIKVHSIGSIDGDLITNEMVKEFVRKFRFALISEFDPLAEDHDEPYLGVTVYQDSY